jgi:hypothetical protein
LPSLSVMTFPFALSVSLADILRSYCHV